MYLLVKKKKRNFDPILYACLSKELVHMWECYGTTCLDFGDLCQVCCVSLYHHEFT